MTRQVTIHYANGAFCVIHVTDLARFETSYHRRGEHGETLFLLRIIRPGGADMFFDGVVRVEIGEPE